jgi:hypothetical protein
MRNKMARAIAAAVPFVSAAALLITAASVAKADCNIRDFIVQDVVSIQQSGTTQLAFVLTATESEYQRAKTNLTGGGDVFGLFSGNLTFGQAKERAREIAQATRFDYMTSYASSYLSQTTSGRALDSYVQCLENDKNSPGLRLWIQKREGDYFTIRGFWIGANTNTPEAKLDAKLIDGGRLIGEPDLWKKGKTEEFVVKRESSTGFYLNMKVGGETKTIVAIADPPAVVWLKQVVTSPRTLTVMSTYSNPCSGTSVEDTIRPVHPGGYFVANTRTTNHTTNDPGHYSETFTVDRPDQVTVRVVQSTGACELRGSATVRLEAMETFPQAAP